MVAPGPAPRRPASPQRARAALVRRRRRRRTKVLVRTLLVAVLAFVVGLGTFIGGLLAAPIDFSVAPPPTAALLLSDDGTQIATIKPPEQRVIVKATDIPLVMREAIISAEDERFLKHNGVDPLATVRAVFRDLTGGNTQGGSTLTQQYVKNVYVGNSRTALRKVREAALSYRLEQRLSKQQILTDYLNVLYLGNGLYGVEAASKYYFGVSIKDLDLDKARKTRSPGLALSRASLLAGIAPAPSAFNPIASFASAKSRQTYTLNRMVANGYITSDQASAASTDHYTTKSSIVRLTPPEAPNVAPEFTDYVTAKIKADPHYDEDAFFRGGERVKTTLDLDLQKAFQQALNEVLPNATDPQAAIVAVDYKNGDVKAMATLRRVPPVVDSKGKVTNDPTSAFKQNGFNLATNALRSTGSTIKTFTLATALTEGRHLTDDFYGPVTGKIKCPTCKGGYYIYGNSGDGEGGRNFTLQSALADSINTVYVPLANDVGRDKVAKLAERAGLAKAGSLEGHPGAAANFLSFGIGGGVDVTPLGEAVGYGTFANGGIHVTPRSFTEVRTGASGTNQGQLLFKVLPKGSRVVSNGVASDVVKALTSVVQYGTATSVRLDQPVFGKTGTTNMSTDGWFTGCLPQERICVASWMGYEYTTCNVGKGKHVNGPCGGMHDIGGVKGQIFGGTLPAKVFTRAQQIYSQIKIDETKGPAGLLPTATLAPTPTPTRRHRIYVTPSATVQATPTATRTKAPAPTTKPTPKSTPTPVSTTRPPIIVPPNPQPSATASPP